jgi:hypothetical protein
LILLGNERFLSGSWEYDAPLKRVGSGFFGQRRDEALEAVESKQLIEYWMDIASGGGV